MTKINIDKAQNIDIIAKKGDDFNLSLTIDDENGAPIYFNNTKTIIETSTEIVDTYFATFPNASINTVLTNGMTITQYREHLLENYHTEQQGRHVLLFTITDVNYNPVLIACSESLNVGTGTTSYTLGASKSEIDYARAVSKVVAGYTNNSGDAQNNYGTETTGLYALNLYDTVNTTVDDKLNSIFNKDSANYVASGTIVNNGVTQSITFKNSDFKLQQGNYKYSFKLMNNLRETSPFSLFPNTKVFRNLTTYLTGKIKVVE